MLSTKYAKPTTDFTFYGSATWKICTLKQPCLIQDLFKLWEAGDVYNRHYPTLLNCHGNICAAILNGAMVLSVVWQTHLYGQRINGGVHTGVYLK